MLRACFATYDLCGELVFVERGERSFHHDDADGWDGDGRDRGTEDEDERLERSCHWTSFLSHVASAAHSSLTSTSRRKQERRCDLRHSSRHGLITIQFLSCGICPV